MRDMKIILLTAMLVAGTGAFAQRESGENNRHNKKDKQKTEVKTERKDSESRHSEARQDSRIRGNREIVYSERDRVRYSERNEHRNDQNSDNRRYDQRNDPQNRERSYGHDRYYGNRGNRNDYGRNYAYGHREHYDEACPLCYQPRLRGGFSIHYSVQDLAGMETRRLAMALDLTEIQIERIYNVNLKYLSRRSGNHYYAMERRERAIRNILRWDQRHDYDIYLRHMDEQELCDDCHVGWGNGKLRIAFNINL